MDLSQVERPACRPCEMATDLSPWSGCFSRMHRGSLPQRRSGGVRRAAEQD